MKRLVGVFALLVAVCLPALWSTGSGVAEETDEPTSITTYRADFTVDADGDLHAVETVPVEVPAWIERRGIFRFFDTHDPSAPQARRIPENIEVTRDGSPENVALTEESRGRYVVARVGSQYRVLPTGVHTYRISYDIDGVLEPGTDGTESQFYWNLVPGGWQQPIAATELTVELPAPPRDVRCAVGAGRSGGCEAEVSGNRIVVRTGELDPRTPVTIKAGLDIATPARGNFVAWSPAWDVVLGRSLIWPPLILVLAGLAGLLGWWASRAASESHPAFPLQYAPPEGIGPAQAAYLLKEKTDRSAFVATLMYAAEQNVLTVDRAPDRTWTITDRAQDADWQRLDGITRNLRSLTQGDAFVASPKDLKAGKRLDGHLDALDGEVANWAEREGLMERTAVAGFGILVILAALAAVVGIAWNPQNMSFAALVPGVFAVGGAGVIRSGAGTRRTPAGRDLWSRIGGFHRVLSTPSSVSRFEFSGREELYTAYLPWAVAFGCADEWANKFRLEMGVEPPVPQHFAAGYAGVHSGAYVDQMVDDFDSTVRSSISAYQASIAPSSSGGGFSGGGGGFSGGGGGGGGGGGSW